MEEKHKLIWIYLLDNCTNAGRWKKSFKHLNFCCGGNIQEEELKQVFNGRIFDYGNFFFMPKFLKFQYPKGLNSEKPAIISVRREVLEYDLLPMIRESLGNDYLIIKDKDKDKDKEGDIKGKVVFPFEEIWSQYPKKLGKKEAERHFRASVKTEEDWKEVQTALKNYLESERVAVKGFIQDGSTWFNWKWKDWITQKEPICPRCHNKGKYISSTGYEIVCDCPKGQAIKIPEHTG